MNETIIEKLKRLYKTKAITYEQIQTLYLNGKITEEEFNEIVREENMEV